MWQRAMSIVLQGCKKVVYYMDDILVTGSTRMEHEANLRHVFQRLQQFGLKINLDKCRLTVNFLGHRISPEGIRPTENRVKGILSAPVPQNKSELKSFIGLVIQFQVLTFLGYSPPSSLQAATEGGEMDVVQGAGTSSHVC